MLPPESVAHAGASLGSGDGAPVPVVVAAATSDEIVAADDLRVDAADDIVDGVTTDRRRSATRENWVTIDSSYAERTLGRDPSDRTVLVSLDEGASAAAVGRRAAGDPRRRPCVSTPPPSAGRHRVRSGRAGRALRAASRDRGDGAAERAGDRDDPHACARRRAGVCSRCCGRSAHRPASATSLALWEIGPPAVAAVIAGTLFGALVPLVVLAARRPALVHRIDGPARATGIDPATLAVTLGGFVAARRAVHRRCLFVSRRVRAASALRTVEEG